MAGYTPRTHYTCAICKRKRPNKNRDETRMICADTQSCMAAVGKAQLLAPKTQAHSVGW